MDKNFDVAVIGSGPGGYVAAIRAAQLGLSVALIEKAEIGGVCLNWGCIPTKALLRSAEVYGLLKKAQDFGININGHSINLELIVLRSKKIAEKLSSGVQFLLTKNKVKVIQGKGTLLDNNRVSIEKENKDSCIVIEAKNIVIATGAKPKEIPGIKVDGVTVWDYKHALRPSEIPKKLIIVGSGAIGIEFASFYNAIGSEVTVLEMQNRILLTEDKDVAEYAQNSFEKKGIKFVLGSRFEVSSLDESGVTLQLEELNGNMREISAPKILIAAGVVGNLEGFGLEKVAVKTKKGTILTNSFCETTVENIYAIGDVTAPPWLAHKASHEGVLVAERIAGIEGVKPINKQQIPGCTYSLPQIASVGMTEDQALENGYKIKVGRVPFLANGKALAMGEDEGFIKTIFDKSTGELLGAHMVGAEVTELISTFLVGKELETTSEEFISTIFPHPTMSEILHESVLSSEEKAIHY